jgi:hypothetical protein
MSVLHVRNQPRGSAIFLGAAALLLTTAFNGACGSTSSSATASGDASTTRPESGAEGVESGADASPGDTGGGTTLEEGGTGVTGVDSGGGGGDSGGDSSVEYPPVVGDELFVSTTGSDSNPGTQAEPFKTVAAAQSAVRASPDKGQKPITVTVMPGTYYLGAPIVFTPADSGTQSAPITYRGGGVALLSGGAALHLTWTAYKNGIMQATVPSSVSTPLSFDGLFLNGQRQRMARYPNYKAGVVPFGGGSADAVSTTRVAGWVHSPVGGFVHGLQAEGWGSEHYVITGVSSSHALVLDGPFANGRPAGLENGTQVVENIFDELDTVNEWYFDKTAGILYFMPPTGIDLSTATIEVSGMERVFDFEGTSTAPVQWITVDGFHYMHTSRTFQKATEIILRSDWEIYRGGTVFVMGTENVNVQNGFFDQVGGAGVFVNGYNRQVNVTGNKFIDTGSSAILFMGLRSAVRNPLVGYGATSVPVAQLDMTPGPLTADYPAESSATDNLIHDIGDPEKQVAGVAIDMSQDITVSHNSIYNMPRAGINVGDGCWGGHVISYNDVFATVLETSDHGAYNSWGRDRYWAGSTSDIEARVAAAPGIQLLDAVKPITMANNRWRCDHGWDVDLDDGSTNYSFTNNVFLSGGLKWREGYNRVGDNNVFAAAGFSIQLWPKNNQDAFTHNILPSYTPTSPDGYGKELDYNFFGSASALSSARSEGHMDTHSSSGTPGYVNAASGNYQVSASSPALAVGIQSLPADVYGVTSLTLRAQAETPPFGKSTQNGGTEDAGNRDPTPETWRGAQVENLIGLDEQSATGIESDVGVFVVTVPAGSQATGDGFLPIDVILEFNGQSVASLDDLNTLYAATTTGQKIPVGVHRNQTDIVLTITR